MDVRGLRVGRVLGRTLRGGLFELDRGQAGGRRVVEVATVGPRDLDDAQFLALGEAMAAGRHPAIPRVYEVAQRGELRTIVMEGIHGWTLRSLLGRRGLSFSVSRLAALGAEIADALAFLHEVGRPFGVAHGRLGLTHVVVEVTGRARVCGFPLPVGVGGVLPDAMGLGAVIASAAVGMVPDPRGATIASLRTLSATLDRPEHAARYPLSFRRFLQSLLLLNPQGFLPSMTVVRAEFERFVGPPLAGRVDPAWSRALSDAVRGLPPGHRPTVSDAEAVVAMLAPSLPSLQAYVPVIENDPVPSDRPARLAGIDPPPAVSPPPVAQQAPVVAAPCDDPDRVPTEPMITLPPAFEMPIVPSLLDVAPPRRRSLRERIFPLLVGS